jgi:hypothetical protein
MPIGRTQCLISAEKSRFLGRCGTWGGEALDVEMLQRRMLHGFVSKCFMASGSGIAGVAAGLGWT